VRALRAKSRTAPRHHPLDLGLPALLTAASVALLVHGLGGGHRLAAGFAPVGLLVGAGQLAYWLRPPREKLHWLLQHMGGMIGSGIASLTAFVVTSAPRLGLGSGSLWLWLAPTALGVPGLIAWQRLYRRRSPPLVAVAP
jgi:hypothetical protein